MAKDKLTSCFLHSVNVDLFIILCLYATFCARYVLLYGVYYSKRSCFLKRKTMQEAEELKGALQATRHEVHFQDG